RLVRIYARDRETGRRPLEELFDTFLHEVAHHLEYTEPDTFDGVFCGRVRGRMHSALFWRILSFLKGRWGEIQSESPDGDSVSGDGFLSRYSKSQRSTLSDDSIDSRA